MRKIGSFPEEGPARKIGDYLLEQGMPNTVEPASDGWAIWVHDDNHLEQAGKDLEIFREEPDHERYRHATTVASAIRKDEAADLRRHAKRRINVRASWSSPFGMARSVTLSMIVASVAVFILTDWGRNPNALFMALLFGDPADKEYGGFGLILHGQVWRLISSMFLHFDILHILFNMIWLHYLGGQIELIKGRKVFITLVLVAQVAASIGQNLVVHPVFGGMSAVVYALFGYIWLKQRYEPHERLWITPFNTFIMLAWLVLCMTDYLGPVANTAHVVGLLIGMIAGGWRTLMLRMRRR